MRRPALLVLAAALLATALPATSSAQAPPPERAYEATIRRTSYGIPHVKADSFGDVAFGMAHAFAEDNICTAADFYVTVNGERSKWFGPDETWRFHGNGMSQTNRSSDFFYASVNASGRIEELLAMEPPHGPLPGVREGVAGFVAGYNQYLADVGGPDGITDPRCKGAGWVRPITEMDVYRRFYQLASLASRGVAIEGIGSAQPPDGGQSPLDAAAQRALDEEVIARWSSAPTRLSQLLGIGSNAYGLGREVTDNGRGIVLGNPHFPWQGGERLYQFHLTVPGQVDVAGAALYGVPIVLIGHTEGVAWSHTVSTAYRFTPMELTLATPTTYLVDGIPEAMQEVEVTIEVRQPDGSLATEARTLYSTRYGPVLTGLAGLPLPWTTNKAFAIQDANDHMRYLNHFFEKNQAQSVRELFDVITRNQGVPWVNTMAADRDGEALYSDVSVVPHVTDEKVRQCATPAGQAAFAALGLPILDGSRSACDWGSDDDAVVDGIFGPGNLPHLFRDDYVHNGNDSYWLSNPNEPLTGFDRIIGDEGTERTLRTRLGLVMVEDRLAGADEYTDLHPDRFTHAIVKAVVNNNRQYAGELTRDGLATLCANLPGGFALGQRGPRDVGPACDVLAAWDGRDDLDSPGAVLFRRFWTRADDGDASVWTTPFDAGDPVHTPRDLNPANPVVQQALADAVADLEGLGAEPDALLRDWQGEDRGDGEFIPIHGGPGSLGVFNAINVSWSSSTGYRNVDHGSSFVMVVQFTDGCPLTSAIVTYSQSEDATSPWFKDQTRLYSDKGWNDMPFCEQDILADPALVVTRVASAGAAPAQPVAPPAAPLPVTGGGIAVVGALALLASRRRRG